VRATRSTGWQSEPGFAAVRVTLMPDDHPDGRSCVFIVSGEARHVLTGTMVTRGWVLEFDAGEAWNLEVTEDMHFWSWVLDE
jgi:hypothetical protein